MEQNLLFEQFATIFDKEEHIQKLNDVILQLAVQGKLVPQDPNDEPASVLLNQLKEEKEQLKIKWKIKELKTLNPIQDDELPYELPMGWVWCKLGEVGVTNIGLTYSPKEISNNGIPVLRSNNIQNGKIELSNLVRVTTEIKPKALVNDGDLIICARNGSRKLVGKTAQILKLNEKMAFGAFMAIFRSRINAYILRFILSPLFRKMIDEVNTMTINQITQKNLKNTIFPLPPLNEQKRIVARIESLQGKVKAITAAFRGKDKKLVSLNKSILHNILNPENGDYKKGKKLLFKNFNLLYSDRRNVKELRAAILQLAVQGKLVPQDPNDEPASVLLEKIKAEKKRLIEAGKIKKQKPLPEISEGEIPYEVPKGWVWCRLGEVCKLITDGKHGDCNNQKNSGYYFLSAKNIQNNQLLYNNARQIVPSEFQLVHNRTNLEPGDICVVNTGATVGKIAIAPENPLTYCTTFQKSVAIIKIIKPFVNVFYLKYFIIFETPRLRSKSGGSAINNLLLGDMRKLLFPIPPIKEQKRIVEKIESLIALCDKIEQNINLKESSRDSLLKAILTHV